MIRIIRGTRLIPWPAIVTAILAAFVAIATLATGAAWPLGPPAAAQPLPWTRQLDPTSILTYPEKSQGNNQILNHTG